MNTTDTDYATMTFVHAVCPKGYLHQNKMKWMAAKFRSLTTPIIPIAVMVALDRMQTPLDKSILTGVTADADASSMKTIADYLFSLSTPQPHEAVELTLAASRDSLAGMLGCGTEDESRPSPAIQERILEAEHQRDILLQAIADAAFKAGLCNGEFSADVDDAILLLANMAERL